MLTRENQELFRAWVYHLRVASPDLDEPSVYVLARRNAVAGRPVPVPPPPRELGIPTEIRPGPLEAIALWKVGRYLRRLKGILMAEIANAPSVLPTRKVGTLLAGLVAWVAYRYFAHEITPDMQDTIASVVVFGLAWWLRDRPNTPVAR